MTTMHVNLGCGEKMVTQSGWLNVDSRKLRPIEGAVFKRLDMRHIRDYLKDGSVQTVRLWDSLEHVARSEAEALLRDCAAILAPGGRLEIKTPAIHLLVKWARTHDEDNTSFRWFGNQDYPENVHKYVWPMATLVDKIETFGLKVESVEEVEDTNIVVKAVKHGGTDHP